MLRPIAQLAEALPVPRRLTRTVTRPLPLRLAALAVGATAILIARARHRSPAAPSEAARSWTDAPSAPSWYVPFEPPISSYDELRATDIAKAVRELENADDVQRVLDYEAAHNQRVTVFRAAKARLRALEAVQ